MDLTEWSKLALICILGAMSPGPSLVVILKNSIEGGLTQGFFAGIGHGLGMSFYALIAVFGLVTFFENIPQFSPIIQIIGSLFLIFLGTKMIITCLAKKIEKDNKEEKIKINQKKGFVEGFLIVFLNPKIAAWTFALFSQFVKPHATISEQIILISTVGGIDALWYCLVATITSNRLVASKFKIYGKIIDLAMGIILVLLALKMIWEVTLKN